MQRSWPPQLKGPVDRGRLGKLSRYKNLWRTPSPPLSALRHYNTGMLSKLKSFAIARPKLASWLFLAVGMVVILIIELIYVFRGKPI